MLITLNKSKWEIVSWLRSGLSATTMWWTTASPLSSNSIQDLLLSKKNSSISSSFTHQVKSSEFFFFSMSWVFEEKVDARVEEQVLVLGHSVKNYKSLLAKYLTCPSKLPFNFFVTLAGVLNRNRALFCS